MPSCAISCGDRSMGVMPMEPRRTSVNSMSWRATVVATFTLMANPMPRAWSRTAVLIPTTRAFASTMGPPLLPSLMGAVWRMRSMRDSWAFADMVTPVLLTMPSVKMGSPGMARA